MYLSINDCLQAGIPTLINRRIKAIPNFSGYFITDDGFVLSDRQLEIKALKVRKQKRASHLSIFIRDDQGKPQHLYVWQLVADAFLFYHDVWDKVLAQYNDGYPLNCSANNLKVFLPYW